MELYLNTVAIKKAKKAYDDLQNTLYTLDSKLDNAKKKSGCYDCDVYMKNYQKLKLEEMFRECSDCKHRKSLIESRDNFIECEKEIEIARKKFAESVFDILTNIKPRLYSRPEKKTVEWEKAFPSEFSSVNPLLYTSLIAFVSGVGGRYIIK